MWITHHSPVATNTTSTVAVPAPSILNGKTIDDIVNRWTTDLDNHVAEFNSFANEVSAWDRALIANGNNVRTLALMLRLRYSNQWKLAALNNMVLAAEREQADIDQALEHIEQQQKELSSTLEVYEKVQDELFGQGGSLRALDTGPADTERDKKSVILLLPPIQKSDNLPSYVLATELYSHLEDLSGSLTQMIDSVNAVTPSTSSDGKSNSTEDPMTQIVQILSSHLESLQWIDGAVHDIEGKVGDVEKRVRDTSGQFNGAAGGMTKQRGFGLR